MDLFVYEVLDKAGKARKKEQKVKILIENESWALKDVLRGTYDSKVHWMLPGGEPPYTANKPESAPSNLLKRNTDFTYFVHGGDGTKLPPYKREAIFIGLIEAIHPEDAKVVINMINKEKIHGITRNIVEEAFPGLLLE